MLATPVDKEITRAERNNRGQGVGEVGVRQRNRLAGSHEPSQANMATTGTVAGGGMGKKYR